MAVQEQVYGFFIPRVTLIGIGASKAIPEKIKALGGSKPLIVTDMGIVKAGILKADNRPSRRREDGLQRV